MNKNKLNIFPKKDDFQTLKSFEKWITFISANYIKRNKIHPYDLSDLQQHIKFRILEQLPSIRKNYRGNSKLRTYISAIILNICREFRRKNCEKSISTKIEINDSLLLNQIEYEYIENKIDIEYEIKALNMVIQTYGDKSSKVKIALKLYFGIKLTYDDLSEYCKNSEVKITEFSSIVNREKKLNKRESIFILNQLFNEVEGKSNSTDATRKWVSRIINRTITMLNIRQCNYNKETLGLLIEKSQAK